KLKGHRGAVNALCKFVRDGKQFIASVSNDEYLIIWDLDQQEHLLKFVDDSRQSSYLLSVTTYFLKEELYIASGNKDFTIIIWDFLKKDKSFKLLGHT